MSNEGTYPQYPDRFVDEILAELDAHELVEIPARRDLSVLLALAHYASLLHEEGRSVTFAIAFIPDALLDFHENPEWMPIRFREALPATVDAIGKLAPALDGRYTAIALTRVGEDMRISGIVKTSLDGYRMKRAESRVGTDIAFGYVRITATDPGSLVIAIHGATIAHLSRGQRLPLASPVLLEDGPVRAILSQNAASIGTETRSSITDLYCLLVLRMLQTIAASGHGGTLLIVPDRTVAPVSKYACSSTTLRDVARHHWAVEFRLQEAGRPPAAWEILPTEQKLRDTLDCVANLAGVDGAVVLGPDLELLGFGSMFKWEGTPVECRQASDAQALETTEFSLTKFGSRHGSAASYVAQNPRSIAFVISEDGPVSCLLCQRPGQPVVLWRPVSLKWLEVAMTRKAG